MQVLNEKQDARVEALISEKGNRSMKEWLRLKATTEEGVVVNGVWYTTEAQLRKAIIAVHLATPGRSVTCQHIKIDGRSVGDINGNVKVRWMSECARHEQKSTACNCPCRRPSR